MKGKERNEKKIKSLALDWFGLVKKKKNKAKRIIFSFISVPLRYSFCSVVFCFVLFLNNKINKKKAQLF